MNAPHLQPIIKQKIWAVSNNCYPLLMWVYVHDVLL